jgi:Clp amino terminal domain, pathogenicity island component
MSTYPLRLDDLIRAVEQEESDVDPLRRVAASVAMAGGLAGLGDELVGHFVDEARLAGASWSEVGDSLGVSKQAAQKRFVMSRPRKGGFGGFFPARFAEDARNVVGVAVEEARKAGSASTGSQHLLLGLIDDPDCRASRLIVALGCPLDRLRAAVTDALPHDKEPGAKGHISFANDSKKVLEIALRETLRARVRQIGTEHILLALLRDKGSAAGKLLAWEGITYENVERAITDGFDD